MNRTGYIVFGYSTAFTHVLRNLLPYEPDSVCFLSTDAPNFLLPPGPVFYVNSKNLRDAALIIADELCRRNLTNIIPCENTPATFRADVVRAWSVKQSNARYQVPQQLANIAKNIPFIQTASPVKNLLRIRGKSVVLCGSGPSLPRSAAYLKTTAAPIMACGSAMAALAYSGITPDYVVIADAGNETVGADYVRMNCPLLAPVQASHDAVKNWSYGPRGFYIDQAALVTPDDLIRFGHELPLIGSNISVTTAAVNLAIYGGASEIILVGQDLSYPAAGHHAPGVQPCDYTRETVDVPALDGSMVVTNYALKDVIDYLTTFPARYPHIRFVNSTAAGALVPGWRRAENLFH